MNKIKNAFDQAYKMIVSTNVDYNIFTSSNVSDLVKTKIENSLSKSFSFWSNYMQSDIPLIVLYADENGYEWLLKMLTKFNFQDAMPKKDRINEVGNVGVTGGGGSIIVNNEDVLFFWQVVGSNGQYVKTGEIKTPPHLFGHAVQGFISKENDKKITDLPPWFIEGQSDYGALVCISNDFSEFESHRINFMRDCYVPGHGSKLKLKNFNKDDWFNSLYNCNIPFEGIPLIDEYYSGFFCYEELVNLIGIEKIKELFFRSMGNEDFYDVFYDLSGINIKEFLIYMSIKLEKFSNFILA